MQPHLGNSTWMYLITGSVSPEYNFDRKAKRQCKSLKKIYLFEQAFRFWRGCQDYDCCCTKKIGAMDLPPKKNILLMQWT